MNKKPLTIGGILAILIAGYFGVQLNEKTDIPVNQSKVESKQIEHTSINDVNSSYQTNNEQAKNESIKIARAFQQRQSNIQVESVGQVIAILPDDNQGSRHQKFILKLDNGLTILIAHNIDLAPRIPHLNKGDTVAFYGEYEYSDKGGVVHWTHHDPNKRHADGWLKHQGKVYQ